MCNILVNDWANAATNTPKWFVEWYNLPRTSHPQTSFTFKSYKYNNYLS